MSFLKRLLGGGGGGSAAAPEPEVYKGFSITPQPAKVDGGYRVGALVEKDGKSHELIRADTIGDPEQARETSVTKAKQVIDQLGDSLFS